MGTSASLLDLIAHGGSLRAGLDNSQVAAETARTQAQVPLINKQTQGADLANQITQRQLRDEEIQRGLWADAGKSLATQAAQPASNDPNAPKIATPAFNGNAPAANASMVPDYLNDPASLAHEAARRGYSNPMALYTQGLALKEKVSKLSADQIALEQANHGQVAQNLQGYLNTPDEQKAQVYPQFYADAVAHEPGLKQELPPPGNGVAPKQGDLAHLIGKVGLFQKLLDQAETTQKTKTSAAQETASAASARKTNIEADQAKMIFDAQQNFLKNPGQGESAIDAALPPAVDAKQNASFKAEFRAAGMDKDNPFGKQAAVVGKAADYNSKINEANNPTLQKGKADTAASTERATAPIQVSKAVAIANATIPAEIKKSVDTQIALAKNSPGAFSNIIEPTARHAAETQYDTATNDYITTASTARDLKDMISAAQHGNKAAPGVIPIAELRSFVTRPNVQELRSVAGAGSLMDKIQGWVGGHAEGQPIPPDILKATSELADIQEKNASRKYDFKLAALKQKGANPQRVELPQASGPVTVQTPHGPMQFPDQTKADAFKKEAGIQ